MRWFEVLILARQLQGVARLARRAPGRAVPVDAAIHTGGGTWVLNSEGLSWLPDDRGD